jgi:hypothetical protein
LNHRQQRYQQSTDHHGDSNHGRSFLLRQDQCEERRKQRRPQGIDKDGISEIIHPAA